MTTFDILHELRAEATRSSTPIADMAALFGLESKSVPVETDAREFSLENPPETRHSRTRERVRYRIIRERIDNRAWGRWQIECYDDHEGWCQVACRPGNYSTEGDACRAILDHHRRECQKRSPRASDRLRAYQKDNDHDQREAGLLLPGLPDPDHPRRTGY